MDTGRAMHDGHAAACAAPAQDDAASTRLVLLAVRRAKAGDKSAFAFLYARFADDVCRFAASLTRNHHDAEDVTQQVFAKLLGIIGQYEQRDVPFQAWLIRVTRNVAVDHMRRRRYVPVAEVRASVEFYDTTSACSAQSLTSALGRLPHAQREVLVLRHLAGLSPAEIAELTGRSEGAVHGLHHRGRKALVSDLRSLGATPVTSAGRSPQPQPS